MNGRVSRRGFSATVKGSDSLPWPPLAVNREPAFFGRRSRHLSNPHLQWALERSATHTPAAWTKAWVVSSCRTVTSPEAGDALLIHFEVFGHHVAIGVAP